MRGQWSYDDTETLGSSERNSEDYVSSPLLSEDTTFSSRQNCVFWSWILSVESGSFACCEICEWFAKTGFFGHRLMVKRQGKWHWFQSPCMHGQWSYDDTETLGSSERNSEDYVSSPLLSEDTTFSSRQNCVCLKLDSFCGVWLLCLLSEFVVRFVSDLPRLASLAIVWWSKEKRQVTLISITLRARAVILWRYRNVRFIWEKQWRLRFFAITVWGHNFLQ